MREREHRDHADEAPDGDQVVDLDLRAEGDARAKRLADDAVGGDAAFAAEEPGNISEAANTSSPMPSVIIANGVPALLASSRSRTARRRTRPPGRRPAAPAMTGNSRAARADPVAAHGSRRRRPGRSTPHGRSDSMPPWPEQHVVGEAEDDRDAHLRQQRAARSRCVKTQRQHEEQQRGAAPDHPAAEVERAKAERCVVVHSVPPACRAGPCGRKIRISTSNRYGRTGATCADRQLQHRDSRRCRA